MLSHTERLGFLSSTRLKNPRHVSAVWTTCIIHHILVTHLFLSMIQAELEAWDNIFSNCHLTIFLVNVKREQIRLCGEETDKIRGVGKSVLLGVNSSLFKENLKLSTRSKIFESNFYIEAFYKLSCLAGQQDINFT